MKQVLKHREDKYSASLHLIDANSGTTFSDEHTPVSKGAIMPSTQTTPVRDREYVAKVRAARKAAIHRRRILVSTLLAVTILVLLLAVVFHFSMLYALIPGVLLAVVLALGAHASKQAKAWEAKQAQRNRAVLEAARKTQQRKDARERRERQERQGHADASRPVGAQASQASQAASPTDVLDQREIRRALRDSRELQQQSKAAQRAHDEQRLREEQLRLQQQQALAQQEDELRRAQEDHTVQQDAAVEAAHADLVVKHIGNAGLGPRAAAPAQHASRQELISFSFDASQEESQSVPADAVESLEIKSMRQVAKAVPVQSAQEHHEPATLRDAQQHDVEHSAPRNEAARSAASATQQADVEPIDHIAIQVELDRQSTPSTTQVQPVAVSRRTHAASVPAAHAAVNDSNAFHRSESSSSVDAPDATDESLGINLDSILARRGN
ncbi:hypothetical protein [Bifidobacterium gallicum]|nr:hypothetical protein [Bifidobacterium gallicum]